MPTVTRAVGVEPAPRRSEGSIEKRFSPKSLSASRSRPTDSESRPAASVAAYAASSEADLIVIATHGLTGLEHFLLGSVTEKVVRTAGCPVLTLKGPPGPDSHEAMAAGLA